MPGPSTAPDSETKPSTPPTRLWVSIRTTLPLAASGNGWAVRKRHPLDKPPFLLCYGRDTMYGLRTILPIYLCLAFTTSTGLFLESSASRTAAGPARPQESSFTDPRDGRTYPTVQVAGMTWFAENLQYAADGSYCYDDADANCERYGRLYPWEVALNACPAGWHLSTEYEWQALELHLGIDFSELDGTRSRGIDQGVQLREGGASGLNVELGGWRRTDGSYASADTSAALWTATEADPFHAWHRDVNTERTALYRSRVYKPYALSVRCVQHRLTPDVLEIGS